MGLSITLSDDQMALIVAKGSECHYYRREELKGHSPLDVYKILSQSLRSSSSMEGRVSLDAVPQEAFDRVESALQGMLTPLSIHSSSSSPISFISSAASEEVTETATQDPPTLSHLQSQELFRRANDKQLRLIADKIDQLPPYSEALLERFAMQILSGDCSKPIFKNPEWLIIAMKAHQRGLLTDAQLAAASHLDVFMHAYPDRLSSIETLDHPDTLTKILKTVDVNRDEVSLDALSPLEKLVLPVPVPHVDRAYEYFLPGLLQDWSAFTNNDTLYIVSPSAAQSIINTLNPGLHPLELFPTFGYSMKMKDFLGIPHKRALGIHCRYIPQPKTLHDGKALTPYCMYYHDFAAHAVMTSFDPFREEEDDLAQYLYELAKELPKEDKKRLMPIAAEFADRPFPYSSPDDLKEFLDTDTISDEAVFWMGCIGAAIQEFGMKISGEDDDEGFVLFFEALSEWAYHQCEHSSVAHPKHLQMLYSQLKISPMTKSFEKAMGMALACLEKKFDLTHS